MTIAPVDGTPFGSFGGNYYPPQHAASGTDGFLSGPVAGDPFSVGLDYLRQNGGAFGVTPTDLNNLTVTNRYADSGSNVTHLYFQQRYNGLPVADSVASVHVMPNGQVITASANFVSGLSYPLANTPLTPEITASDAVSEFSVLAGLSFDGSLDLVAPATGRSQKTTYSDAELSADPIPVQLQYVPAPGGGVDLAWQIIARPPNSDHWFDVAVAASGSRAGQVIRVADWAADATYNVFPFPLKDPGEGSRSIISDPINAIASPFGWHDTDSIPGAEFTDTRGNNVFAQDDLDGNNTGGTRPNGGAGLVFNSPLDLSQPPIVNLDAAITQLFASANTIHDISYRYGFTEAAGNFQLTNYSGLGAGNDPVLADAQDAFAVNNAFMATPPDGFSPQLAMGISTFTFPNRDRDFQNVTITHEYTHGITNRLTGGPANANALQAIQSGGMGEGWSDWLALTLTMQAGDNKNMAQSYGNWVVGLPPGSDGIRRQPYSFNMQIDPLTLANFNGVDPLTGVPNWEVHNAGEIWASALWDMTWLLTEKYGFNPDLVNGTGGNNLAIQLVFDALKLQPANPSFLQARDSIIASDIARTGGENFELIWSAFARRGFGASAVDGGSSSLIVNARFDVPAGPARVTGTVFNDANNSQSRDSGETGLGGWVVYADANNNSALDATERSTTTAADGSYALRMFQVGQATIRQVVQPGWTQTTPANNAGRVVSIVRGQTISGQNFGSRGIPAEIRGVVWNDFDADSVRDAEEPTLSNLVVYIDINNDGRLNLLEHFATTDNFGRYSIKNVSPGAYTLRVVAQPGLTGTPPTQTVTVGAGQVLTGIELGFAQVFEQDFGDLPNSYGTTRAANGARHGILPGFHLGALLDRDADGQPNLTATGDDSAFQPDPQPDPLPTSPDDEDGIVFLTGLTPGFPATIQVTVNTGTAFTGRLHGWIDFNRDGDFANDPGEKIILGTLLPTGVHNVTFNVPANAQFGSTYARFRYGYESTLNATGSAMAGEVEDYAVNLLANVPIAAPDTFAVKQGQTDVVLDVLANDTPTTFGIPQIVPGSFPATLPSGSTLRLNALGNRILYTPAPFVLGLESFTYRVTDGNTVSAPGLVNITVTIRDPLAVDDSVIVPFVATPASTQINVLANDIFPFANTTIIDVQKLTTDPATGPASMTIAPGGSALNFVPPSGFRGTIIYQYTISDADPSTTDANGLLTIQVVDVSGSTPSPAPSHLAQLGVQILSLAGTPISAVNVGDEFLVRMSSRDLRQFGDDTNRGVEAAYLDLLFNRDLVEPVLNSANPLGFEITFDPLYTLAQFGTANSPAPGQIDEAGAAHPSESSGTTIIGVGPGLHTVFTVRMRAKAATPAGQPIQFFGSPAEFVTTPVGNINSDVLIMPNDQTVDPAPIVLRDEQVFLLPSSPLTIAGLGEGEFTNFVNPLDVDRNGAVAPLDAVLIINELNGPGGRTLSPLQYETSGFARPTNLLDVSMDSVLAPLDAVLVINYLNAKNAQLASAQAAAAPLAAGGEGESESLFEGSGADDEALLAAVLLSEDDSQPVSAPSSDSTSSSPDDQVLPTSSASSANVGSSAEENLEFSSQFSTIAADAVDALLASYADSQPAATTSLLPLASRFNLKSRTTR